MAQKPIGYYGEFRPTGVDQSAARRFQALAGLADQVGDIAFQIGAKKAEQVGAEEGEKAGLEAAKNLSTPGAEAPKTRKGFLASMSIQDQAYNTALKSSFLTSVSEDAKNGIERLAAQYPDNVKAFQKNVEQFSQGLLQGVGEEYRDIVNATVNDYVARAETQVFKNEIQQNRITAKNNQLGRISSLSNEAAKRISEGDEEGATASILERDVIIESMLTTEDITLSEATSYREKTSERIETQRQVRIVKKIILDPENDDETNLQNARQALEAFREADFPGQTPESLERIESSIRGEIAEFRAQISGDVAAKSQANALRFSNLQIAASNNLQPSSESRLQADAMLEIGEITAPQRTQIYNATYKQDEKIAARAQAISKVAKKLAEREQLISSVKAQLSGDESSSPVLRKDANTYYDEFEKDFIGVPAKQANFIKNIGVVPSRMQERTEMDINSGDPVRMEQAIELIDRIDEIPGMFGELVSADQEALAAQIITLSEVMPMDQAVKEARRIVNPSNANYIEDRRKIIKDKKYANKYKTWTNDAISDGGLFDRGDMPVGRALSQAENQFEMLFDTYFTNGMSASQAKNKVSKIMQTNWTDSEFGLMPYAPEKYYPVSGDIIRDQVYQEVTSVAGNDVKKDNVYLLTDEVTARKASSRQPAYIIMYQTKDGGFATVYDKTTGKNKYWYPDVAAAEEQQRKDIKKSMEERRAIGMTGEEAALSRQFQPGF